MNARITVDASEFQRSFRQYVLKTNRELSKVITARLFYLLVRYFVLLPPQRPDVKRREIRDYLNHKIGDVNRVDPKTGKRIGKRRLKDVLSRVHLIAQAKNRVAGNKGLYGEEMKRAAAALRRRAIGSVGYLKSGVAKAIRQINGHFVQAGSPSRKGKPATYVNSALARIRNEYGLAGAGNVGTHRGSRAKAQPARPGFNPSAWASIDIGLADDQMGKVGAIMNQSLQRALNDERAEIDRHLAERAKEVASEFTKTT